MEKITFLLLLSILFIQGCGLLNDDDRCGFPPGPTIDFVDTLSVAVVSDTTYLSLYRPLGDSATYEVLKSPSLKDTLMIVSTIHGEQLNDDSVRSKKEFNWRNDTLYVSFAYDTYSTIVQREETVSSKGLKEEVQCSPIPENFRIRSATIIVPVNKTVIMYMDEYFGWKKK